MIDTLKPLIKQFMPFAQERMGFKKPPRLFLRKDENNARNPLGRTAFYDPEQMSVTLYISGRHPKDIMRSLSHELVHHTQNCNGMFDDAGETSEGYAQNDDHLREMEREAYEQGNLCFRDWEDGIKNTIYFEHLQKGVKKKMSTKKWKNNELNTLLTEQWGFSMDLSKLSEAAKPDFIDLDGDGDKEESMKKAAADKKKKKMDENDEVFAPNHYCVHHGGVERNGSVEMAEAVSHNYNTELGKVTHYDMKFSDGFIMENVAFEDIQVTNASLAQEHMHSVGKRDDEEEESKNEGMHEPGKRDERCPECKNKKADCKCPEDKKVDEAHCGKRDDEDLDEAHCGKRDDDKEDVKERRARGRDREGMQPDSRRRPMQEAILRQRIRKALKNVKFK